VSFVGHRSLLVVVGSAAVSDTPVPDAQTPPDATGGLELEVDLAAFLPEGVTLAGADDPADDDPPVGGASDVEASSDLERAGEAEDDPSVDEAPAPELDLGVLAQIERDLDAVDAAIAALDAGTYGLDPATGAPIDDAVLAEDPTRLS
jgi:hypothetical protein